MKKSEKSKIIVVDVEKEYEWCIRNVTNIMNEKINPLAIIKTEDDH